MSNPSVSALKTNYEKFVEAHQLQKNLYNRTLNIQKKLLELRLKVDELIKNLWDSIEAYFEKYPPIIKREKCKSYGIHYVYRKNEEKIELDDILNFSNH